MKGGKVMRREGNERIDREKWEVKTREGGRSSSIRERGREGVQR